MSATIEVKESFPDIFDTAKQAAAEIFTDSSTSFEEIKNRPWYKSLLNAITFQRCDKKMVVRNVRSLASLQSLYMEVYTQQLKCQDSELDALMQQILNTQQFAYKMYISCVLQLKPQTNFPELPETDQQILLLFLSEFNRSDRLDSDNKEKIQRYNRGVSSSLYVSRPTSEFNPEQLEKVQFPDVFYRCVLEQCAVTDRLDPLHMPDNISEAIQWLDISEKKKERIVEGVKAEIKDFGAPFFFEKYEKREVLFNEDDLELVEEPLDLPDENASVLQEADLKTDTADLREAVYPYYELTKLVKDYTETKKLGNPLTKDISEDQKNKLIAKLLPTILPVSKAVLEIAKTSNGHIVFTTHALYWVTSREFHKVSYKDLRLDYMGTKLIKDKIAFVYTPAGEQQIVISGIDTEWMEKMLSEIIALDKYAESDVLTKFEDLPQKIQFTYMQLLASVIRESGHSLHEVYRLAIQYNLIDHWEVINTALDLPFEEAFRNFIEQVPYPNEDTISISLLRDLCTVYQYTKDSDILTVPEKKYFSVIFNGSSKDRDDIIRFALMEKQLIEQRIDFSGISGKKITDVEMRQKTHEKIMQSYQVAEKTAKEYGYNEFASQLQGEALKIADRIGFRYFGHSESELAILKDIMREIVEFINNIPDEGYKPCKVAKNMTDEELGRVIKDLEDCGFEKSKNDIIAIYEPGVVFLFDGIYSRKNKFVPMPYLDMQKIEGTMLTTTLYGRDGRTIKFGGLSPASLTELLTKLFNITQEALKEGCEPSDT